MAIGRFFASLLIVQLVESLIDDFIYRFLRRNQLSLLPKLMHLLTF